MSWIMSPITTGRRDFLTTYKTYLQKEMQLLWAKVLAGEVERPGSTSIRTLSILRNLDQATAGLFRKFCSAAVFFIPDGKVPIDARVPSLEGNAASNSLQTYGLGFGALNVLNEHGLIIADYNSWFDYGLCIGMVFSSETKQRMVRIPFGFQGRYWVLWPKTERTVDKTFRLSGVALTRAGQELSKIVGLTPMNEYAQALMEFFRAKNLQMTEVDSWQP